MSLFLHIWLIFFTYNLLSMDYSSLFLMPEEYDRKLIFGDNKLGLSLLGDISYFYFSKPSLLAKSCNTFQYVQQVYDLVLSYSVEDYLLAKVDLRSRILWGSNQDLIIGNSLNFLGAGYGDHSHGVENKNFFWLREGWVNLDLSRFMGLTRSVNLTIGTIPYMVGRGISYGIVYSELPGFIGANSGAVIEAFAPAVLLSMELYSNKNHTLFGDLYCAILNNWSGSLEENIDPIYEKRIWHCPDKPERGFGHINTAMVAQLKYETVNKYGLLQIQPYVLCNLSPESNIILSRNSFIDLSVLIYFFKIPAFNIQNNAQSTLSSSKLITLGCMINWHSDRFCFNFEWAINKGGLKIYGIDNNRSQILNYLGEDFLSNSALTVNNTDVISGVYKPDSSGPLINGYRLFYSFVNDLDQSIIGNSPEGPEYNITFLSFYPAFLFNSTSRFVNPKKINYQGAMAVLDFAYWLKPDKFVLASTAGFATGGSFELNQIYGWISRDELEETGRITALDESGSYGGFISTQELYTGLWVKSAFGMGGPFIRPNLSTYVDYTSSNQGLLFKELFTDIKFLGFSANFFPTERLSFSSNTTYYWSFCAPTEVFAKNDDPFLPYNINKYKLSKNLGLEVFLIGIYESHKSLNLYLSWAMFFPGSRYFDKYINPLDYFDSYYINKNSSTITKPEVLFEFLSSLPPDTTKFNPVYLFNTGFVYSF
jgi:hypothetical protein